MVYQKRIGLQDRSPRQLLKRKTASIDTDLQWGESRRPFFCPR